MEKEFVPYEIALELKSLGFNEPCMKGYTEEYKKLISFSSTYTNTSVEKTLPTKPLTAPLYQQAFRFFREKYKISGEISSDFYLEGKDNEWEYNIYQLGKEDDGYVGTINIFKTYEEAELECLKKLIEIVKNK